MLGLVRGCSRGLRRLLRRRLQKRDVATYFVFVFLSFVLWYFFSLQVPCESTVEVPVVVRHCDSMYVVRSEDMGCVRVRVSDIGYKLRELRREGMFLEVRVCDDGGEVWMSHSDLVQRVGLLFSESVTVLGVEPESLQLGYTVLRRKRVGIVLDAHFEPVSQHYIVGDPIVLEEEVEVMGPAGVLDTLGAIHTSGEVFRVVSDTGVVFVPLVIPEGISVGQNYVGVRVNTEAFTEKSFDLPVEVRGLCRRCGMIVFPSQVRVIIKVANRNFDLVGASDFVVFCDFPVGEKPSVLPLLVESSSPYVLQWRVEPSHVEYIIEHR